jgi:polysaccharide deacetylase 2 family uncharacterized protein YibQ
VTVAGVSAGQPPRLSIIIDDMGDKERAGLRAIHLPGAVTYAFLPRTPHSRALATEAHLLGKEVMLHLPMQAVGDNRLGPGGLTLDMDREQFNRTLQKDLASIPYVVGINNHMGSLLTRHPGYMRWLMEEMAQTGSLYFIDSRTTRYTVAEQVAREQHIPSRRRDIFLDNDPTPAAVKRQFERLVRVAIKNGSAIGIGHPYDTTLSQLAKMLPQLKAMGVELLPVSQLVYDKKPAVIMADDESESVPETPGPLVFHDGGDDVSVTPFHLHQHN